MPNVLPLLLVAGVAVVATSSKKKRKKPEANGEPDDAPGHAWPQEEEDLPPPSLPGKFTITARPSTRDPVDFGEICGPVSQRRAGVWTAFDQRGRCVEFWNRQSDKVMGEYILDEFRKLNASKKAACANDVWEKDPFSNAGVGKWVPNATKLKVLMRALKRAYPQIPAERLPPTPTDPYYMQIVWKFSEAIYMREVCNYVPVT